jgi:hypothetical protein
MDFVPRSIDVVGGIVYLYPTNKSCRSDSENKRK